ncbi:hypothetical protein TTHERM_00566700 (macronuclear) [Tetrahymena thermophila SB210]|uniref:Uncharacterized protein n=1 Tax=Tetrahymena thermophila (strain SB210) TaxID=312017 RepID=I7M306_TETTS|nr:hypothetical protein TTHERM_00566700 [Tetrahymena thermophila SB210]EAS01826.2 hypothetical protein TTHERM_00566700 [Tetrahymena thermophila SB210]|eukprot:XP_001022071.2 hypothetical protein TTHERM_00566700 [Tetrahymena thermophila SB210]
MRRALPQQVNFILNNQDKPLKELRNLTGLSVSTIRRIKLRNIYPPLRSPGRQHRFKSINEVYNLLQQEGIPLDFQDKKFAGTLRATLINYFNDPKISLKYCYYLKKKLEQFSQSQDQSMHNSQNQNPTQIQGSPAYSVLLSSNHNNSQQQNIQLNQTQYTHNNQIYSNNEQFTATGFNIHQDDIQSYTSYSDQYFQENNNQQGLNFPQFENDANSNSQNNFSYESPQFEVPQNLLPEYDYSELSNHDHQEINGLYSNAQNQTFSESQQYPQLNLSKQGEQQSNDQDEESYNFLQ